MVSYTRSKKQRVSKMEPYSVGDLVVYCQDMEYFLDHDGEGERWEDIDGAVMTVNEFTADNQYPYNCSIPGAQMYSFDADELELASGITWEKRRTNKLGMFPRKKGDE